MVIVHSLSSLFPFFLSSILILLSPKLAETRTETTDRPDGPSRTSQIPLPLSTTGFSSEVTKVNSDDTVTSKAWFIGTLSGVSVLVCLLILLSIGLAFRCRHSAGEESMILTRKSSESSGDIFFSAQNPFAGARNGRSLKFINPLIVTTGGGAGPLAPAGGSLPSLTSSDKMVDNIFEQPTKEDCEDTREEERDVSTSDLQHNQREKVKMLNRPRLSLCLGLTPISSPYSGTSSECDSSDDDETQRVLSSSSRRMTRPELRESLISVAPLHAEFWGLPFNHEETAVVGSGPKNRYRTILPNLQSRVILPEVNDDPLMSYINANYIRGFKEKPNDYVAAQGPLPNTIYDFWRMVIHSGASTIVMLTNLREKQKQKCEKYWPSFEEPKELQFDDIAVKSTGEKKFDGYVVTSLVIQYQNTSHKVLHFWYNSWPDQGIPESPLPLICLIRHVNCCRAKLPSAPALIHCSAGIGRTGCYIATDIGIQQLKEGTVDLLRVLCQMRQDRGGMVQTSEQYEFVHRALAFFEQGLDDTGLNEDSESLVSLLSDW